MSDQETDTWIVELPKDLLCMRCGAYWHCEHKERRRALQQRLVNALAASDPFHALHDRYRALLP
jgi:hypothetical protein